MKRQCAHSAMPIAAGSTENMVGEKWPPLALRDPTPLVEAATQAQRSLFYCDRDKREVLEGNPGGEAASS